MIEELLVPTDEARNEHKRLQLQELAALNGKATQCSASLIRCVALQSALTCSVVRVLALRLCWPAQNWCVIWVHSHS